MQISRQDGFEKSRDAILAPALRMAVFDGWTPLMLRAAAAEAGVEPARMTAAFPKGISDLLAYWSERLDQEMVAAMQAPAFKELKIREKVAFAIRRRLDAVKPHKEAARRAAATLALPMHARLGMRLTWGTADNVWRAMGDPSTDFNFYSKRAILCGVWASTLTHWFNDDSPGEESTNAFLAARIENVMEIEKFKSRLRKAEVDLEKPVKWLAGLRYRA